MKNKTTLQNKLIELVQKDPFFANFIIVAADIGIYAFTYEGTKIAIYDNRKTGITVIIDPTKPTFSIIDHSDNETIHITPDLTKKILRRTFGNPEYKSIPKFYTNLIPDMEPPELEDLKNTP